MKIARTQTVIGVNKIICCKDSWDMNQFEVWDVRCARLFQYSWLALHFILCEFQKTTQLSNIVLIIYSTSVVRRSLYIVHRLVLYFIVGFCYLCGRVYRIWHILTFVYSIEFIAILWFFWKHFWFYEISNELLMSVFFLHMYIRPLGKHI